VGNHSREKEVESQWRQLIRDAERSSQEDCAVCAFVDQIYSIAEVEARNNYSRDPLSGVS
jgi:hypothetical protein